MSLIVLSMQEKGEIQKLYNKWWKSGGGCIRNEKKDSRASELNFENVYGTFFVLVMGLLIAVLISIFEFIYTAKKNKKNVGDYIF